ncbi:MAG TPA: hypothetical protein VN884_11975 [Candidatus Sulfotelmatobacter sp.]|jgi:hypothetical protein|nr:hypothetical protein [Candidatus Sulfotelmatobacter sp.]
MGSSLVRSSRGTPLVFAAAILAALLPAFAFLSSPDAAGQQRQDVPGDEIIANLAAGRVIIAVVKDAILIATIENPFEPQTRLPAPVELSSRRAGVFLGAVEWISPSSQVEFARLDLDLPHLRGRVSSQAPSLQQAQPNAEASDIDAIGHGVSERLNEIAKNLHGKITLPPNEPLAELILADYMENYGPEIWQLTFTLKQSMQREDYFDTHIPLPQYVQLWPPEKGQPHTLVEFHYPPENAAPSLGALLRNKDASIEKLCSSDPKMREVRDRFLQGESNKILAVDAIQFLRAALGIVASTNSRETFATISVESGFQWILKPPPEPKKPGQQKDRPDEAPSLLHPSF